MVHGSAVTCAPSASLRKPRSSSALLQPRSDESRPRRLPSMATNPALPPPPYVNRARPPQCCSDESRPRRIPSMATNPTLHPRIKQRRFLPSSNRAAEASFHPKIKQPRLRPSPPGLDGSSRVTTWLAAWVALASRAGVAGGRGLEIGELARVSNEFEHPPSVPFLGLNTLITGLTDGARHNQQWRWRERLMHERRLESSLRNVKILYGSVTYLTSTVFLSVQCQLNTPLICCF
jgi:hypothetical protein